jgi:hypothetical protein
MSGGATTTINEAEFSQNASTFSNKLKEVDLISKTPPPDINVPKTII